MADDIALPWGSDLGITATGDLATIGGEAGATQRIIRRLLTNPGDYIWNQAYGAGLAGFVGGTTVGGRIEAVIRAQMLLEPSVARIPAPKIAAMSRDSRVTGAFAVGIHYTNAMTGQPSSVVVPVTG